MPSESSVISREVESLKCYIGGRWEEAEATGFSQVYNPAKGAVIAAAPRSGAGVVERAVKAAHRAFLEWRDVPVVERVQVLYRYKTLLEQESESLARTLTSENGKTLDDARAEVRRGIQMVEVACGMPSLMMGEALANVARGIDCHSIRQPLGVCAGITPFNFPAMVPMWMYPFAIACGNSFVLKPSEKPPITPTRTFELLHEAGLPAGVCNLVHGEGEAAEALVRHPLVKAVSFVGSTPIARQVYAESARHGKRVQALGGAKNHLVAMADADIERTVEAILSSAFGAAGERCLAGSVLVLVGEGYQPLLDRLVSRARSLRLGDGAESGVEMGPLVTAAHRQRVSGYVAHGMAEGAEVLCDGREQGGGETGFFLGATIFDRVTPQMKIGQEEIFGPVLSVMRAANLNEAIGLVNASPFGNTTSIFTRDGGAAREYAQRVEAGMVGINIGVAAPMAFFPFSGWKESFFGDLHAHGKDAVSFYTEQKVVMSRW